MKEAGRCGKGGTEKLNQYLPHLGCGVKVEILRFPRSPETAVGLAPGQRICTRKATLGNSAESVDDALRTGLWALYYDVPWVFWG